MKSNIIRLKFKRRFSCFFYLSFSFKSFQGQVTIVALVLNVQKMLVVNHADKDGMANAFVEPAISWSQVGRHDLA